MTRIVLLACAVLLAAAGSPAGEAAAQMRGGPGRTDTRTTERETTRAVVLSAYPLLYTGFGTVYDPGTESRWLFADAALGGGGAVHVEVSNGLLVGIDAAVARTNYERRPRTAQTALDAGTASISSLQAGLRMSGGGLGRMGGMGAMRALMGLGNLGYVSAGAGAIRYGLENVAGTNTDLAFHLGGGLELLDAGGRGGFLEFKQFWAFHEREGVDDSTVRHSRLELGARLALRR
jgi:hypothetical protein